MPSHRLRVSRRRTQPTRHRSFYNPVGFDPLQVLPFHLHRYANHARFFLHVLYAQRVFKEIKEEFVPLKAAYMRRFFPSNEVYKQIRDALLESRTIVCDGVSGGNADDQDHSVQSGGSGSPLRRSCLLGGLRRVSI